MEELAADKEMWRRTMRACRLAALFYVPAVVGFILAMLLVGTFFATAGNPQPPDTSAIDAIGYAGLYALPVLLLAATYNIVRAVLWSFRGMRSPSAAKRHPWTAFFIAGLVVPYFQFHGSLNYVIG